MIVVYALAGLAVIQAAALAAVSVLLARSRREADTLRRRVDTRNLLLSGGQEAVKTVWQTANLMRREGFGAAVRSSIEDLADWAEVERPRPCPRHPGRPSGDPVLRYRGVDRS